MVIGSEPDVENAWNPARIWAPRFLTARDGPAGTRRFTGINGEPVAGIGAEFDWQPSVPAGYEGKKYANLKMFWREIRTMSPGMFQRWVLPSACVMIAAAAWLHVYRTSSDAGWDFPQFYIAAHIPLPDLYDYRSFAATGHSLLDQESVRYYPPYVRPALFALPLRILRYLSYRTAFRIWAAFQVLLLVISALLIGRTFRGLPKIWLLPFLASSPAFYGVIFGQDGAVVLLVLAATLYCLATGRNGLSGVLLGVGLYKFNLILLLPVYLIVARQWRALTGFAVTACLAAALSAIVAPAGDYLHLLGHIPEIAQGFLPENMIGIRGLAATLRMPWLYLTGVALIAPLALVAAAKSGLKTGFAIALTGSMLCAYHINGYDGTLAAIPLVALMAKAEDYVPRILLGAAIVWLGRPPMWLSPLILVAVLAGLITLPRPAEAERA